MTVFFSWRWGFGFELIIILFILALSSKIKNFPSITKFSELDKLGTILPSSGIMIFVLGILSLGYIKNLELSLLIMSIGIILLVFFYLREKNLLNSDKIPLTDIRLFKNRNFVLGTFIRLILSLALAGAGFILPTFFQLEIGLNAFIRISDFTFNIWHFCICHDIVKDSCTNGSKKPISMGLFVALVSCLYLSNQFNLNTKLIDIIPGTFILGIGLILIIGTINGLYHAYDENLPNQFSKAQINQKLSMYIQKDGTTHDILKGKENTVLYSIVNSTIRNAMKLAFQFVSVIFLISVLVYLLNRYIFVKVWHSVRFLYVGPHR